MQAFADLQEYQHREVAWAAWHTAALGRIKKMPTLEEMVGEKVVAVVQSAEQMKGVFAAMRARAG